MSSVGHHHPAPDPAESSASPSAGDRYSVSGMHCAGCASGLQEALLALPGVRSATVDFIGGMAVVDGSTPGATILEAISQQGFDGASLAPEFDLTETRSRLEKTQARSARLWRRRAVVGLGLWAPLEIMHWTLHGQAHPWLPWVMLIGSAVVLAVAGGGFYASAWNAARRGGTNMDTLISIGATTAFGWSLLVFIMQRTGGETAPIWQDRPLYFAESAALLGVISLGHWLEANASARAGAAVRDLLELQPD
ncbi:MAG: cation transporter, partial [Planctomycetota bacterium]|nr:cation transporter [Planctomycetota bacterium]